MIKSRTSLVALVLAALFSAPVLGCDCGAIDARTSYPLRPFFYVNEFAWMITAHVCVRSEGKDCEVVWPTDMSITWGDGTTDRGWTPPYDYCWYGYNAGCTMMFFQRGQPRL